jgi:hypothetical protein
LRRRHGDQTEQQTGFGREPRVHFGKPERDTTPENRYEGTFK